MAKLSKKQKSALAKFDKTKVYSLEEAVSVVKTLLIQSLMLLLILMYA